MTNKDTKNVKYKRDFNNPLGEILPSNQDFSSYFIDCSDKSDEAILIKTQVIEYLEDVKLKEHEQQRVIQAANNLLALL